MTNFHMKKNVLLCDSTRIGKKPSHTFGVITRIIKSILAHVFVWVVFLLAEHAVADPAAHLVEDYVAAHGILAIHDQAVDDRELAGGDCLLESTDLAWLNGNDTYGSSLSNTLMF